MVGHGAQRRGLQCHATPHLWVAVGPMTMKRALPLSLALALRLLAGPHVGSSSPNCTKYQHLVYVRLSKTKLLIASSVRQMRLIQFLLLLINFRKIFLESEKHTHKALCLIIFKKSQLTSANEWFLHTRSISVCLLASLTFVFLYWYLIYFYYKAKMLCWTFSVH